MGQVSSSLNQDSSYGGGCPLFISDLLDLISVEIKSTDGTRKLFRIDPLTKQVQPPISPLSTFTQNDDLSQFPFLLNVEHDDVIRLNLKLGRSTYDALNQDTVEGVQVFREIKAKVYDVSDELVIEQPLLKEVQLINHDKTTVDPSCIQVVKGNNKSVDFDLVIELEKMLKVGKIKVSILGNEKEIVKFGGFINKSERIDTLLPNKGSYKSELSDKTFNNLNAVSLQEDCPQFQREISQLETNIVNLKTILKNIIRKAHIFDENLRNLAITRSSLSNSLSDLINYSIKVDNKILHDLVREMTLMLTEKSAQDIAQSNTLSQYLVNPLVSLHNDLKLLRVKNSMYQDKKLEYNNLLKYEPEMEFQKIKEYELVRFEYLNFLNEFRKGQLIRNLTHKFALFYKESFPNDCDVLKAPLAFYESYQDYKLNRDLLKKSIEDCQSQKQLNEILGVSKLSNQSSKVLMSSSSLDKDLPQPVEKKYKVNKRDILFALDPETASWRKKYVVLKDNKLEEFDVLESKANAQQSHKRCDSINLAAASINKLRIKDKQKCCIEINTKSGVRKIFQVYNESEQQSWFRSLTTATTLSTFDGSDTKETPSIRHSSKHGPSQRRSMFNPAERTDSSQTRADSTPLQIVQEVDTSNRICCDCGSADSTDWLSLTLLIALCENCAEIHETLGEKWPKVFSLRTERSVFENSECRELLYHVSNRIANSYWSANLDREALLKSKCSLQERNEFITKKYLFKSFICQEPTFKPRDSLIKGVKSQNVFLILKALCLGASPSSVLVTKENAGKTVEIGLFEYSLSKFVTDTVDGKPIFYISQLLFLNGVDIGTEVRNGLPLTDAQKAYWKAKIDEQAGPGVARRNTVSVLRSNRFSLRRTLTSKKPQSSEKEAAKDNITRRLSFWRK